MKVQCNIAQHGAITYSYFAHNRAIMKTIMSQHGETR